MSDFFNSLFDKKPSPPMPSLAPPAKPSASYQKGDVIGGKYEVRRELGKGGFGVVYLAFNRETKRLCALKTFKDEFLVDVATRAAFKKEVLLWVNLGQHPNIVSARHNDENRQSEILLPPRRDQNDRLGLFADLLLRISFEFRISTFAFAGGRS